MSMVHDRAMAGLKDHLKCLLKDIPIGADVVFVDYPVYFNVGDLLIDSGTQAFFQSFSHQIKGRFSIGDLGRCNGTEFVAGRSISILDACARDGATIVCQGGGNLGDIWPEHQLCREMLVRRYPDSKIVILPQSIEFRSEKNADRAMKVFRDHGGVSIYVRDQWSLDLTDKFAVKSTLVPDMAHQLWREVDNGAQTLESSTLRVFRRDIEKRVNLPGLQGDSFDWDDVVGLKERGLLKLFQAAELAGPLVRRHFETYPLWRFIEGRLIDAALNVFRCHDRIITDRLHAMILGALLSKRVEFHDNSYGKLQRYHSIWLVKSPTVQPAFADASSL